MTWVAVAIAGSAIVSGAVQSSAARKAARAQMGAAELAAEEQRRQYDTTREDLEPFRRRGYAGLDRLSMLLGLEGDPRGEGYGSLTRRFGAADLEADPIYAQALKFGLDEGLKGIKRARAAQGGLASGEAMKALSDYTSGSVSRYGGDAFNRYMSSNDALFNRLAGITGIGQTSTNQAAQLGAQTAGNIGNLITGAGNARAAGIVGGANAWGNALQQGVNAYTGQQNLDRILAAYNRPSYGGSYPASGSYYSGNEAPF